MVEEDEAALDDDEDDEPESVTPSAAAVFVLGGSQNGWTEWISDGGETLNQVYRSEEN